MSQKSGWASICRQNIGNGWFTNKNGSAEPGELKPAVLFKHADRNDDKQVSQKEYLAMYLPLFQGRDTNDDGKLVMAEIRKN